MSPSELCPVIMCDKKECGRPIHPAPVGTDPTPVCLMHSKDPDKPSEQFSAEFERILDGTSSAHRPLDCFDFTGFVFNGSLFTGREYARAVVFSHAIFTRGAEFYGATFTRGAKFEEVTFNEVAQFNSAAFNQDADFSGATFKGAAQFWAKFNQHARFSRATFAGHAQFSNVTFHRGASFSHATFLRVPDSFVDFTGATFGYAADFEWAKFDNYTLFQEAIFTGDVSFLGATFPKAVTFGKASFAQNADFQHATFGKGAFFGKVTFSGKANFSKTRFPEVASFSIATFAHDATFSSATFERLADFSGATFAQDAVFSGATFDGKIDFAGLSLAGVLDLRDVSILDAEVLLRVVNQKTEIDVGNLSANDTRKRILPGACVRLRRTLLERIRFEDVRWHRQGGRLVLQDELDVEKREQDATYELVADAYRRLINNFEKARQYEWAEEAVVGVMEMRRLDPERFPFGGRARVREFYQRHTGPRWLAEHVSVTSLYRLLSLYGSNYTRALSWLGAFLLVFALLFSWAGLQMIPKPVAAPLGTVAVSPVPELPVISWSSAWSNPNRFRELWGTFKSGLWVSVGTATFQRDKLFEPANNYGRALAIFESIAVPGQTALFLLALRRRFRR